MTQMHLRKNRNNIHELTLFNVKLFIENELIYPAWLKINKTGQIESFNYGQIKGDIDGGGNYLLPGLIDFHCCAFKSFLCPRYKIYMPFEGAKQIFEMVCLKSGITTIFNTVRLSDIFVSNEININDSNEFNTICSDFKFSNETINHFIHLRCDLGSPDIVDNVITYLSQNMPSTICRN